MLSSEVWLPTSTTAGWRAFDAYVARRAQVPATWSSPTLFMRAMLPTVWPSVPALVVASPLLMVSHVDARTPVEQTLVEIWQQVLGVKKVGVHDNFFELGGDSILSIQIMARARQVGLWLTPRELFEHQTVAELEERGVEFTEDVADHGYGLVTHFKMPGGVIVQLYQPRYSKRN